DLLALGGEARRPRPIRPDRDLAADEQQPAGAADLDRLRVAALRGRRFGRIDVALHAGRGTFRGLGGPKKDHARCRSASISSVAEIEDKRRTTMRFMMIVK